MSEVRDSLSCLLSQIDYKILSRRDIQGRLFNASQNASILEQQLKMLEMFINDSVTKYINADNYVNKNLLANFKAQANISDGSFLTNIINGIEDVGNSIITAEEGTFFWIAGNVEGVINDGINQLENLGSEALDWAKEEYDDVKKWYDNNWEMLDNVGTWCGGISAALGVAAAITFFCPPLSGALGIASVAFGVAGFGIDTLLTATGKFTLDKGIEKIVLDGLALVPAGASLKITSKLIDGTEEVAKMSKLELLSKTIKDTVQTDSWKELLKTKLDPSKWILDLEKEAKPYTQLILKNNPYISESEAMARGLTQATLKVVGVDHFGGVFGAVSSFVSLGVDAKKKEESEKDR
jgi:hypothetical protein